MDKLNRARVFIETYGCQMNLNDTEIVSSILSDSGMEMSETIDNADVILLNTCSVRDNAEKRIRERLIHLKQYKKKNNKLLVGILGCMAERLKDKLIEKEKLVGIVIGPDEYRKAPELISNALDGEPGIAVKLSRVETYDNIEPLRTQGISAWLSIMRGCNNFCSYCVVPFTRGRERSRPFKSLIDEVKRLWDEGFKEVTLLGQNVNSYLDEDTGQDFPGLLSACAEAVPEMRIRFTTSHPKDLSDKLIDTIANYPNVCNHIHLAMQSGSNRMLDLMNRKYTIEHYIGRIEKMREKIPNCVFSTDIIAGFPGETVEDHEETLDAMEKIKFDGAFMFKYSPRENTKAYKMNDDVPEEEKIRRLNEIIEFQQAMSKKLNSEEVGRIHEVLIEGPSKKNPDEWRGRSKTDKVVIFPLNGKKVNVGELANVKINRYTSATLFGDMVEK